MPTGPQGDKISDPTADRSNPPVCRQSGQPMATPESRQQFRETRSATYPFLREGKSGCRGQNPECRQLVSAFEIWCVTLRLVVICWRGFADKSQFAGKGKGLLCTDKNGSQQIAILAFRSRQTARAARAGSRHAARAASREQGAGESREQASREQASREQASRELQLGPSEIAQCSWRCTCSSS